jgi:hypothetical protein
VVFGIKRISPKGRAKVTFPGVNTIEIMEAMDKNRLILSQNQ